MKFLGSATVTGKNQITIPQKVVQTLKLNKGDPLIFLQDENKNIYIAIEVTLPQKE
ncbi:MAG: AbrB/MazE/SpoVT family DNA-binding domain-containing protein [Candidatus Heimdallarchaeota archaeon]|nr:MAG: AbrB/MazE/SpoVT family DNA-binding domain-containing protein [Candidatus Heimdallarchaeota archaeon]